MHGLLKPHTSGGMNLFQVSIAELAELICLAFFFRAALRWTDYGGIELISAGTHGTSLTLLCRKARDVKALHDFLDSVITGASHR